MNIRYSGATRRRASAAGRSVLAVAFVLMGAAGPVSAGPQRGRAANQRPAQGPGNLRAYGTAQGWRTYAPYPVKDPTAAERAVLAGRVYRTVLDGWVQRAMTPARPEGKPPDDDALFSLELAERLGQWSLRWQEAQDNAAKTLAGRYQALSDHLGRMSSLEDGRFWREAVKPAGFLTGRPVEPKPPRVFAEIARFFRPVDEWDIDRVVPELVDFERPLNPRGIAVTPAERVEIAGRAYRAVLDEAVDRFLASPRAGEARPDEAAIFDALLAERLGSWSDLWRQAQDATGTDPSLGSAAARYRLARLALAGERLAGPDSRPATVRSHLERMSALESGRFLDDALKQAGHPAVEHVDMTRLREFAAVARFFRIEAECKLPEASRPKGTDVTASSRVEAAGRIYQTILDGAARRYLEKPRAGGAPPDARPDFDARLAERLGSWSIRWGRAQASAGEGPVSRFAAVRSHVERMGSLEDGRSLYDALARVDPLIGKPVAAAPPREFAEVARFFRLEALWDLELIKSR